MLKHLSVANKQRKGTVLVLRRNKAVLLMGQHQQQVTTHWTTKVMGKAKLVLQKVK
jgi:hypothetical protein